MRWRNNTENRRPIPMAGRLNVSHHRQSADVLIQFARSRSDGARGRLRSI
jgi:hypothetical protein